MELPVQRESIGDGIMKVCFFLAGFSKDEFNTLSVSRVTVTVTCKPVVFLWNCK